MRSKYYYYTAVVKFVLLFLLGWKETDLMKGFFLAIIGFDLTTLPATLMTHWYFSKWAIKYTKDKEILENPSTIVNFGVFVLLLFGFISAMTVYGYMLQYVKIKGVRWILYMMAKMYLVVWSLFVIIVSLSPLTNIPITSTTRTTTI